MDGTLQTVFSLVTIPVVFVLSYVMLNTRFGPGELIGACLVTIYACAFSLFIYNSHLISLASFRPFSPCFSFSVFFCFIFFFHLFCCIFFFSFSLFFFLSIFLLSHFALSVSHSYVSHQPISLSCILCAVKPLCGRK